MATISDKNVNTSSQVDKNFNPSTQTDINGTVTNIGVIKQGSIGTYGDTRINYGSSNFNYGGYRI